MRGIINLKLNNNYYNLNVINKLQKLNENKLKKIQKAGKKNTEKVLGKIFVIKLFIKSYQQKQTELLVLKLKKKVIIFIKNQIIII